ncbi:MAG TPA: YceI family protein [Pyrinomonadaceae bacterium]|nr:YceI family protein [Pyrinomonadaceae bacterium]
MRKQLSVIVLFVVALVTFACADPASDKPKATVAEAQPQSSAQKPAETLVISPENSKIEFVASKVTRSHQGSFKQFSGKIELVPNNIPESRVSIDIDTASVETDEPQLTGHLKTPDFFDVAKNPKATFESTRIEPGNSGSNYTITGNFDLHGVKKSITFPANIQVTADAAAVDAEFAINRKDFGIVYAGKADDLIRDAVVIKLNLRVPRKKQ